MLMEREDAPLACRAVIGRVPATAQMPLLLAIERAIVEQGPRRWQPIAADVQALGSGGGGGWLGPTVRRVLAALSRGAAAPAVPSPKPKVDELIARLDSNDPVVRSVVCGELARLRSPGRDGHLRAMRRGGVAAQRRCAMALLTGEQTAPEWLATYFARAPEAWVAARGVRDLLAHTERARSPNPQWTEVALRVGARADVLDVLDRDSILAGDVFSSAVLAGPAGVPFLREAWSRPRLRREVLNLLPRLGRHARTCLPDVLRALRTEQSGVAARSVLAMALTPNSDGFAGLRVAVEVVWREAQHHERTELLPAIAALGDRAEFARDDVASLLGRGGSLPIGSGRLGPQGQLRAWLEIALRGGRDAEQEIALLVLASGNRSGRIPPGDVERLWRQAAESDPLVAVVHDWVEEVRGDDAKARRLVEAALDSISTGRPMPAVSVVLSSCEAATRAALPGFLQSRRGDAEILRIIASSCPLVFLDVIASESARSWLRYRPLEGLPVGRLDVIRRLERGLADASPVMAKACARALVLQGEMALPVIESHLFGTSGHGDSLRRALREVGSPAGFVVECFDRLLSRELATDDQLASLASLLGVPGARWLARRVDDREALVKMLEQSVTHGDDATSAAALRLLATEDRDAAVRAAPSALARNRDEAARWAGLLLLDDPAAASDAVGIAQLFYAREPLVRRRALQMLARARAWPDDLGAAATALLQDGVVEVRIDAIAAFAARPREAARSARALREARATETDPRVAAALGRLPALR